MYSYCSVAESSCVLDCISIFLLAEKAWFFLESQYSHKLQKLEIPTMFLGYFDSIT